LAVLVNVPIFPKLAGLYHGPEQAHEFEEPVRLHKAADEYGAERGVFHGSSAQR